MMQGNNRSSDIYTKKHEYTLWIERWNFYIPPVATEINHWILKHWEENPYYNN